MTPATFSFVIPILNEERRIAPLLKRLQLLYPGAQVVVVDGGSRDTSVAQAHNRCSKVLHSPPGRAVQMNAGAKQASGEYLLFLHVDTFPSIEMEPLQAALSARPEWGFFAVRLSGVQWMFRVIERAMNVRSSLSRVATGDQLIFIRRDVFEQTSGYAAIPLMEDIEYCKRLRRRAPPLVISQAVETSSRRWEQHGIVSTIIRMWALRLAYVLGVSPARLGQYYFTK